MNFDLQENEINKYIIYREAVILTIDEKGFYESNTFNGIQIRRIGIDASNEIKDFFEQYNLLDDNELSALYESRINQKQGLSQIKQQMKKDEIKVTKLYGKMEVCENYMNFLDKWQKSSILKKSQQIIFIYSLLQLIFSL